MQTDVRDDQIVETPMARGWCNTLDWLAVSSKPSMNWQAPTLFARERRRTAANVAKLPELLRKPQTSIDPLPL
jgi:hypothetical protein